MSRSLVFPYPAVQYIPIPLKIFSQFPAVPERPSLMVDDSFARIHSQIIEFAAGEATLNPFDDETLLLGLGIEASDLRYRGYYATMQTSQVNSGFIASIPIRYFYKNPVIFQARDNGGKLLASCQYELKDRRNR